MLPKNSYLRLANNDFYNIEKHKKFIYSKQHESAAEFLSFIFNQLQSPTPDLMEYLNYKEENSLICEHCKTSRIISEFEAPILNININDINNKKKMNNAIKEMLEYEIESIAPENIQMEEGDDDGDNAIEEIENSVQLDLVKRMMLPCLTEEDVLNKKFYIVSTNSNIG
uniref:USP domain-containing protein n=1 Tax=Strongyloides papillosus TaxID=174720 RepID=A0A0N5CBX9_STREA